MTYSLQRKRKPSDPYKHNGSKWVCVGISQNIDNLEKLLIDGDGPYRVKYKNTVLLESEAREISVIMNFK